MNRRKAVKIAAGVIAGSGAGLFAASYATRPAIPDAKEPHRVDYKHPESNWNYAPLNPDVTAQLAYNYYSEGSCMYATIKSVIAQLAETYGEPYVSFPFQMFRYGHGGIGGYGSVCGSLNGAAALVGLLVHDKNVQDLMITDIFSWYEKESFPAFTPVKAGYDYTPAVSVSNSVLCHASNTNWCKATGFTVASNERKERCRRLTADVAHKVTDCLNLITANVYVSGMHADNSSGTCISCHGNEGKLKNTSAQMSCKSCHPESPAHKAFANIHYKLMKE
jgi:hypothetical protein